MLPRRFFAAAALAVVLVLSVPAVTAHAATAPSTTVNAITPGQTPYVPPSLLSTKTLLPGGVSKYLAGLLWRAGNSVRQSVQASAFKGLTDPVGQTSTTTGKGNASAPFCTYAYTIAGGPWGTTIPITRTDTRTSEPWSQPVDCTPGADKGSVTCVDPNGSLISWGAKDIPKGSAGVVHGCPAGYGVASFTQAPTAPAGALYASDGFRFINPDYSAMLAGSTVIKSEKVCHSTTSGVSDVTVTSAGPPGSGVISPAQCPAGTYPISERIYSTSGGLMPQDLSTTGLAPNVLSNSYAPCLTGAQSCALEVSINGVKCLVSILLCKTWLDQSQQSGGGGVTCTWGGYLMPTSDCAPLENCYKVPLDSIAGNSSGSACGIDPDQPVGTAPAPIQDGHVQGPTPAPSSGSGGSAPTPIITVNVPQPTVNVSVTVNVPPPTVIVNVPQPTVNVTVNAPAPDPVEVPGILSDCWAEDAAATGGEDGKAGILAAAAAAGAPANPHLSPEGYPSFDIMSSGALNTSIAETMRTNHSRFGLHYVISQMRIASAKSNWNWRPYTPITDQGDFQHTGHVHVSYGLTTSSGSAGWNPVDWAYKPMKCAISNAVAPTEGKSEETRKAVGDALGSPLKPWTDALGSYGSAFAVGPASCQGPAMALGHPFDVTLYPASSCTEPAKTLALISRLGTGALLIVTGLWACVRLLAAGLGYNVGGSGAE